MSTIDDLHRTESDELRDEADVRLKQQDLVRAQDRLMQDKRKKINLQVQVDEERQATERKRRDDERKKREESSKRRIV